MNDTLPKVDSPLQHVKTSIFENTHTPSNPHSNGQSVPEADEISSVIEDLKSLLECSICRERYINPKMLPCQHAFCSECLKKLKKRMNWNCPICRKRFPPNASRSCLILNNLIEMASHHECLSAPREESSPLPEQGSVDDSHEMAFSFDLSEFDQSDIYSAEEYLSEDEYAPGLYDSDESISSYLIRNRLLDYNEVIVNLNDISDNSFDIILSSSPMRTNASSSQTTRAQANRRRRANRRTQAGNTNNTNSNTNVAVPRVDNEPRIFQRCPDWPRCHDDVACNYTHPRRRCRNNPCRFGRNCCFLHSRDMPSFHGIVS